MSVEDPIKALDLLSQKKFDLVFLDVDMPNMDGLELTRAVRRIAEKAKSGQLEPADISEKVISEHLWTRNIPRPLTWLKWSCF